jgi:predicted NUDIX family NTP pyrophosphohydrolase
MSAKQSSGTLLYREGKDGLEVLLVHPSGWYNKSAPWSIPKGEPDTNEDDLEATARRETWEETGVQVTGALAYLGEIIYRKSKKHVHCYAGAAPENAEPRVASWEVDRSEFVPLERARALLRPDQVPFLDRLVDHLK